MAGALKTFHREDLPASFEFFACCMPLALVSRSAVVGERCVLAVEKEESKLYQSLSGNALRGARELVLGKWEEPLQRWKDMILLFGERMIVAALGSINTLARCSKAFRNGMKDSLDDGSLYESFSFFLSPEFLGVVSAGSAFQARFALADLALSLAIPADSQSWALDKGLLKVVAAVYEATSMRDLRKETKLRITPAHLCNIVLANLLQTPAGIEKLRAHNALKGFQPHKRKINEGGPHAEVWRSIETKLRGLPGEWVLSSAHSELPQPTILCSWKLCTTGPEEIVGKKFGKCALCQVARYCR